MLSNDCEGRMRDLLSLKGDREAEFFTDVKNSELPVVICGAGQAAMQMKKRLNTVGSDTVFAAILEYARSSGSVSTDDIYNEYSEYFPYGLRPFSRCFFFSFFASAPGVA